MEIENLAANSERNIFFLEMAKKSGIANRMDYSVCYKGYGCKVIPDKDNPYLWHIEFDAPVKDVTTNMKKCPFCGSDDGLEVVASRETDNIAKVVKCLSCGAIGPYGASNKDLAIEFWNKRD